MNVNKLFKLFDSDTPKSYIESIGNFYENLCELAGEPVTLTVKPLPLGNVEVYVEGRVKVHTVCPKDSMTTEAYKLAKIVGSYAPKK